MLSYRQKIDKTVESRAGKLWEYAINTSRVSGTLGLSSPFSSIKNVLLGEAGIYSAYGIRAMKAGWEGMFDPEITRLAQEVAAKQVGHSYLQEVSIQNILTKGMEATEWANRVRGVASTVFYVKDSINLLNGINPHFII